MEDIMLNKEKNIKLRCPLTKKILETDATAKNSINAIVEATSLLTVDAKTLLVEQVK